MVLYRAKLATSVTTALVLLAVFAVPQAASGADRVTADPRIAAVMADIPGGVLVERNRAVWPDLDMEMETPADEVTLLAVGGCATGYVCVFDSYSAQGAKISWSTCGNPTVSSFTVRSIANARSSGYAQARNGTTVRATANAGSFVNVYTSVNNVRCVR